MARTVIDLDKDLLAEAQRLFGTTTKVAVTEHTVAHGVRELRHSNGSSAAS